MQLPLVFRNERAKLLFKITKNLSPHPVVRSYKNYQNSLKKYNKKTKIRTKHFLGDTKIAAITARDKWIRSNSSRICTVRHSLPHEMISLASQRGVGKYGYWNLYPVRGRRRRWDARVTYSQELHDPGILGDVSDMTDKLVHLYDHKSSEDPLGQLNVRDFLVSTLRKWSQETQITSVSKSSGGKKYLHIHPEWGHDPLLLSLSHPMMRHMRALRIGASELNAHSYHRKGLSSPGCAYCGHSSESTHHFFLECPHFNAQRRKLLTAVTPTLRKLKSEPTVSSLLGMFPFLSSRRKEKKSRHLRKIIFNHTLTFLLETERFKE